MPGIAVSFYRSTTDNPRTQSRSVNRFAVRRVSLITHFAIDRAWFLRSSRERISLPITFSRNRQSTSLFPGIKSSGDCSNSSIPYDFRPSFQLHTHAEDNANWMEFTASLLRPPRPRIHRVMLLVCRWERISK